LFAEAALSASLTVQNPSPDPVLTPGREFSLVFEIRGDAPPTDFLLSGIEGPDLEGLREMNRRVTAVSGTDGGSGGVRYRVRFDLKALAPGEALFHPVRFSFMDASGGTRACETESFSFSIVPWYRKHLGLLVALGVLLAAAGFGTAGVRRLEKRRREKKRARRRAAFHRFAAEKERETLKAMRGLRRYVIAGEYGEYCRELLECVADYFRACHPGAAFKGVAEMRRRLPRLLPGDAHVRVDEFLNQLEEIRFAGKKPLSSELDRLQESARDLVARHREAFEPKADADPLPDDGSAD
jgi:hypothetical protein